MLDSYITISEQELQKFTNYINLFHGINGKYSSGRDVTTEEVNQALQEQYSNPFHDYNWGGGDSVDREFILPFIFSEEEFNKMYK